MFVFLLFLSSAASIVCNQYHRERSEFQIPSESKTRFNLNGIFQIVWNCVAIQPLYFSISRKFFWFVGVIPKCVLALVKPNSRNKASYIEKLCSNYSNNPSHTFPKKSIPRIKNRKKNNWKNYHCLSLVRYFPIGMFVLFPKTFSMEFGKRIAQIIAVDMIYRRCRDAKNAIKMIFMFDICLMCMNRLRNKIISWEKPMCRQSASINFFYNNVYYWPYYIRSILFVDSSIWGIFEFLAMLTLSFILFPFPFKMTSFSSHISGKSYDFHYFYCHWFRFIQIYFIFIATQ